MAAILPLQAEQEQVMPLRGNRGVGKTVNQGAIDTESVCSHSAREKSTLKDIAAEIKGKIRDNYLKDYRV